MPASNYSLGLRSITQCLGVYPEECRWNHIYFNDKTDWGYKGEDWRSLGLSEHAWGALEWWSYSKKCWSKPLFPTTRFGSIHATGRLLRWWVDNEVNKSEMDRSGKFYVWLTLNRLEFNTYMGEYLESMRSKKPATGGPVHSYLHGRYSPVSSMFLVDYSVPKEFDYRAWKRGELTEHADKLEAWGLPPEPRTSIAPKVLPPRNVMKNPSENPSESLSQDLAIRPLDTIQMPTVDCGGAREQEVRYLPAAYLVARQRASKGTAYGLGSPVTLKASEGPKSAIKSMVAFSGLSEQEAIKAIEAERRQAEALRKSDQGRGQAYRSRCESRAKADIEAFTKGWDQGADADFKSKNHVDAYVIRAVYTLFGPSRGDYRGCLTLRRGMIDFAERTFCHRVQNGYTTRKKELDALGLRAARIVGQWNQIGTKGPGRRLIPPRIGGKPTSKKRLFALFEEQGLPLGD